MTRPWTVYIVRCADGTLYCGVAVDVEARIGTHQKGKGARYTRGRLPVRLVYQQRGLDRGAALRRELEIKKLSRAAKLSLIESGDSGPQATERKSRGKSQGEPCGIGRGKRLSRKRPCQE